MPIRQPITQNNSTSKKSQLGHFVSRMINIGSEFVSGVILGLGIGLFIDWYFSTSPFGVIISFFLGSCAGMLNLYRSLMKCRD